ncbi:hypothetical protein LEP1GSC124_4326 [Leptospira interrogans serovar Pyrogenes str. 200701872]|uniref:Uncharacterized protein n=1 Tax=Leptospira interrogans serovar Pyrogenes str. 200701872 TaxID=1193029 RepID=M7A5B8_LEPIR|nr:hypothetical protein LEP1GSC124_4326 [Leptospira interrogans serovar Pyrogenes str. 200701872]
MNLDALKFNDCDQVQFRKRLIKTFLKKLQELSILELINNRFATFPK